jgi:hypothetical protein
MSTPTLAIFRPFEPFAVWRATAGLVEIQPEAPGPIPYAGADGRIYAGADGRAYAAPAPEAA